MATFCPVCPAHMYADLKKWDESSIRNNLFLAHDVVADADSYAKVFQSFQHRSIMDNSLVELGGAVDLPMVKEASKIVGAKVFVLPDVYGKGEETADAVCGAYQEWKEAIPAAQPMAVIQGETFKDWINCLETIVAKCHLHWYAVPRKTSDFDVPRRILAELVHAYVPHAKIHFLGFTDDIAEDIFSARHPAVSSIDSAVPLRLGTQGKPFSLNADPGPRGDWWDSCEWSPLVGLNVRQTQRLVSTPTQLRNADINY